MSLDVRALLEETGALLTGHFRLSSGLHSPNYVQCARLLEHPRNAKALGAALAERLLNVGRASARLPRGGRAEAHPTLNKIVSPALGGVIIGYAVAQALDVPFVFTERKDGAMTLRRGFGIREGERVVIVEDVVTTGKSTRETVDVIARQGGDVTGFASILNRSGKANPFDKPYEALLDLELATYPEDACPQCSQEVPLDAPGSRYSR
ncbi:MAG TPA: orotate phosphoribosyltransferase [Thermoanaerobaculia bacterium]|nr:orotate phosphoribosyltransferase [Thermoanaerobaculia bacterium]